MGNDKTGRVRGGRVGIEARGEDPGENVRSFAGLVDDRRTLRLLNYYDGLIDGRSKTRRSAVSSFRTPRRGQSTRRSDTGASRK